MADSLKRVNKLLDDLRDEFQIKSDRKLAKLIGAIPSNISSIRSGRIPFGSTYILSIHEVFDIPIKEIKERIGAA